MTARTATTSTFINIDGTRTLEYSPVPRHFRKGGAWVPVATKLASDGAFRPSGRVVDDPAGSHPKASAAMSVTGQTADVQVRFRPFAEGLDVTFRSDSFRLVPQGARNVRPRADSSTGHQIVTYVDAWPGVDVQYELLGGSLKETVVLNRPGTASSFSFRLVGATASPDALHKGGLALSGISSKDFFITPLSVSVTGRGFISEPVAKQSATDDLISLSLDAKWLSKLPPSAYPVAVDPSFENNVGGTYGNFKAYKSDGYSCTSATCDPQAGSLNDAGVWKSWRTMFRIPFDQLSGKVLQGARLRLHKKVRTYWTGTDAAVNVNNQWAPCFGFNCTHGPSGSGWQGIGNDGWVNVTQPVAWMVQNGQWGGWFMINGQEGAATTYKQWEPLDLVMHVDYDTPSPMTDVNTAAPADGQVVVTTQPSLNVGPVGDADGDLVRYYFRVSTNPDAETGALINSGWIGAPQWTVPEGVLQDGSTYYWHVWTWDGVNGTPGTFPTWKKSFKVDLRTGKDSTQAYDQAGPLGIDLATGNATTGTSTHSIAALGGNIGLSLDYNSPARAVQGLDAKYWNVPAGYGGALPAGAPQLVRTDPNVDFNWSTGSPDAAITSDWFFAQWKGYFVAPVKGNYNFGASNDDSVTVTVNGIQAYNNGGCYAGICYGANVAASTVPLEAGQVAPIEIRFMEATGPGYARIFVKGPVTERILPKEWLRTAPRTAYQSTGLIGRYYTDDGVTHTFPANQSDPFRLLMVRTDPTVNFNWGAGAPVPSGPVDNFMVRWRGYITVPADGVYSLGASTDDGIRVKLTMPDGTEKAGLDLWQDQAGTFWGNAAQQLTLTKNTPYPITVDYFEHGGGASVSLLVKGPGLSAAGQEVPATWLTPKANVLPDGWGLGLDPDGNVNYERLRVTSNDVTLYDSTGESHTYTANGRGGFTPPVNEDGILTRNADSTLTLVDTDGRTYVFNAEGVLTSVTSPQDDKRPAALRYEYAGNPTRLTKISDGVDATRTGTLAYSGDPECATPVGYDPVPSGMLCAFKTSDGAKTSLYYKAGRLARVERPGSEMTDFGYDALGRITSARDTLAVDAVNAGIRADDATVTSEVGYDDVGRVATVTLPAATVGATRLKHSFEYLAGATQEHLTPGSEPNGYIRRVDYDTLYRTVSDKDVAALATTTEWDPVKDLVRSTTDPTGLKSTTLYDLDDRPTDSYGPAPATWFGADGRPSAANAAGTPHTLTRYDEGIVGTSVAWYNVKGSTLFGAPLLHTTGINPAADPKWLGRNFQSGTPVTPAPGMDGYGFSATGRMQFPGAGTYTLKVWHDDGVRIWIDDQLVIDDWAYRSEGIVQNAPAGTFTAVAGKDYRFRFDYLHVGTPGAVELWMAGPGITDTNAGLGTSRPTFLLPAYGLTTSTTVFDSQTGDVTNTTSYGSQPELGQAVATVEDKNGANLTTAFTYEPYQPGSLMRQTSKTLPGGNTYTYVYYDATATADNPCTAATEAYKQAGMAKGKVEPDPDGNGPRAGRTSETVYDDAGRVVATRFNADPWTCSTYDARGRVAVTTVPAITLNGEVRDGRTINNDYAVGGNPLVTATWDAGGWIVTWTDLLGRVVKYRDVHDDETVTTYDDQGHVTSRSGPLGLEEFTYDSYDRLVDQKLDGTTYAHVTYDAYGRMSNVIYPTAGQQKATYSRDDLGRLNGISYITGDGATVADSVTRSVTGDVINGTENGVNKSYVYDGAGRLTRAVLGTTTFQYDYSAPAATQCAQPSANLAAQKSGNRTAMSVTNPDVNAGAPSVTTYCYNYADQLIASNDASVDGGDYDAHGNMTSLGSVATPLRFAYDASDRNTGVVQRDDNGNGIASYYSRDVQNRVTGRYKNDIANWTWTAAGDTFYGFTSSGDTPDFAKAGVGSTAPVMEKYLSLPGNVLLTIRVGQSPAAQSATFSLPNIHGDIFATSDGAGLLSASFVAGPFGEPLASSGGIPGATTPTRGPPPQNTGTQGLAAGSTYGYLGQHQKLTEAQFALDVVQMGQRVYIPLVGRFLQVDPIEGGTDNSYVYPGDPVNDFDLDGTFGFKALGRIALKAANVGSYIPGPIGMVSTGVAVAVNLAAGNYAGAAAEAVGFIPGGKLAKLGGKATVRLTEERFQHIVARHWSTSAATNAGKFRPGTTRRELKRMIDSTYARGASRPNTDNRPGTIYEHKFRRSIGVDSKGRSTSRLRVVVKRGKVVTAFPY